MDKPKCFTIISHDKDDDINVNCGVYDTKCEAITKALRFCSLAKNDLVPIDRIEIYYDYLGEDEKPVWSYVK